jgi:hypothetical protein
MLPRKTRSPAISATLTMLVAAFLLAVLVFVTPAPAFTDNASLETAGPDVICRCCQSLWFCHSIAQTYYCHYDGRLYKCEWIEQCFDGCCTLGVGKWAWKGHNCSYIGQGCTPRGDVQPCGIY